MHDDLKKPEGGNPTIGIILCTEKSETIVKYSIINDTSRMFASRYKSCLPAEEEFIAEIEREKSLIKERLKDKVHPVNQ